MMNQETECRTAFENWASTLGLPLDRTSLYQDEETHLAWMGWRAAWGQRSHRIDELLAIIGDVDETLMRAGDDWWFTKYHVKANALLAAMAAANE